MKYLILVLLVFGLIGCVDVDRTKRTLQDNGYTNIEIIGYDALGCSDSDYFSTGFTATSPNGVKVRGVVCSGWLKGATIRFK